MESHEGKRAVESPTDTPAPGLPEAAGVELTERPRSAEQPRRRRGGDRRSQTGFNDSVDRMYCQRFETEIAPAFPIQHRTRTASLRVMVVDRRSSALLLCDSGHHGEHQWPDGIELDPIPDGALEDFLKP